MSDTELTETEAERLRQLLHLAADSLEVTTPDAGPADLHPGAQRPGRGRWLFAAAAILVVVAVGAAWWLAADDADRIDSGPAEPPVTVAPQVLEQAGIWRLPEGLDGYRVVLAQDGGSFDSSSVDSPGVLAVDDPDEPTRWLMVQAYDELGEVPGNARQVALSDAVTASLVPTEGSTWFRITPAGEGSSEQVVSGSALGIDEVELTALLTEHFGTTDSLASAGDSTAAMEAMLDDAGVGEDRLVWQGDGDGGPGSSNEQVQVTLAGDDGAEVVVIMNQADDPAWSVAVRLRLTAELLSLSSAGTAQDTLSIRPRTELGRNVLENVASVPGQPSASSLVVISDDGAWISAFPAVATATGSPAAPTTLTVEQQLRIINSLRAMSEAEFRDRLSELGVEFVESSTPDGTVTTVLGDPDD